MAGKCIFIANCRCTPTPVNQFDWDDLQAQGARIEPGYGTVEKPKAITQAKSKPTPPAQPAPRKPLDQLTPDDVQGMSRKELLEVAQEYGLQPGKRTTETLRQRIATDIEMGIAKPATATPEPAPATPQPTPTPAPAAKPKPAKDPKVVVAKAIPLLARENTVTIADLQDATGLDYPTLHQAINDLRREGVIAGSSIEGRDGVDQRTLDSLIDPKGESIGSVQVRRPEDLARIASGKPAEPTPAAAPEQPKIDLATMPPAQQSATIQAIANATPTGGFGTNKVLLSHVYDNLKAADPTLTRAQFEAMLLEASQRGELELSRSDLPFLLNPADVAASTVKHTNGEFQFIVTPNNFDRAPSVNPDRVRQAPPLTDKERKAIEKAKIEKALGIKPKPPKAPKAKAPDAATAPNVAPAPADVAPPEPTLPEPTAPEPEPAPEPDPEPTAPYQPVAPKLTPKPRPLPHQELDPNRAPYLPPEARQGMTRDVADRAVQHLSAGNKSLSAKEAAALVGDEATLKDLVARGLVTESKGLFSRSYQFAPKAAEVAIQTQQAKPLAVPKTLKDLQAVKERYSLATPAERAAMREYFGIGDLQSTVLPGDPALASEIADELARRIERNINPITIGEKLAASPHESAREAFVAKVEAIAKKAPASNREEKAREAFVNTFRAAAPSALPVAVHDARSEPLVKSAVGFLNKLKPDDGSKPPPIRTAMDPAKARAHYDDTKREINLRADMPTEVLVHEIGHSIETDNPEILAACHAFLDHRCGDEPFKPLADIGTSYGEREMGRDDNFAKAFGGDKESGRYAGKVYGRAATEVLSMGLEQLYRDPVAFAKNDPEYFNFVLGVLHGDARMKTIPKE